MATGWVKALQCKSRALEDVVVFRHNHQNRNKLRHTKQTNPKSNHHNLIPDAASCRKSVQNLKDVVETTTSAKQKQSKSRKSKPPSPRSPPPCLSPSPAQKVTTTKRSFSTKPDQFVTQQPTRSQPSTSTRRSRSAESFFPALSELPEGHPSRNVVEIIFHTSWSPKAFSGRIEMVFKVQNLSRTVARFEEYREIVKSRAESAGKLVVAAEGEREGEGEDHARCVADGNEVMRFYCLGPTSGSGAYDTCGGGGGGGGVWTFNGNKGAAVCTFSGSGTAHENAGGGRGRRAMLVCRVISGRVCKELGFESLIEGRVGYDSVSGENGELLVFDSRAVLPCFLIIYKL